MRLSTALCFGLLVLALGSLAPQRADAWATVCADNLIEANCYANATSCHWNFTAAACQNDTAATCEDIYRDTTTCGATSGCAVNGNNKHCYTALVACAAIVSDPTLCQLRGDCTLGANVTVDCAAATNTSKPYGYNTDPIGCVETGYFYDTFTPESAAGAGTCFYSASAARAVYGASCDLYSGYVQPYAAVACMIHTGCTFDALTASCTAAPTGSVTPDPLPLALNRHLGDTDSSFRASFIIPVVLIGAIIVLLALATVWSIVRAPSDGANRSGTSAKAKKKTGTGGKKVRASERELSGILTEKH